MARRREEKANSDAEYMENLILDENFHSYEVLLRSFEVTMLNPKDKLLVNYLLSQARKLHKLPNLEVKRYNNEFMRTFVRVAKWTVEHQPVECYKAWFNANNRKEHSVWLQSNKSYMATIKLSPTKFVVYSAMSSRPCDGWVENGLQDVRDEIDKSFKNDIPREFD